MTRINRSSKRSRCLCLGLALSWIPTWASAQFDQYTAPGSFEEQRESTEELLDRAVKDARWLLGSIAVEPWISLRDFAYVDSADRGDSGARAESDLKATVGVGLKAYVPVGRELTLALHALPEYVWWKDRSGRNRVDGRYGAGLFGNLGRTGVELSATRQDEGRLVSREVERQANVRQQEVTAAFELDLGRGVTAFGAGSLRQFRFMPEAEDAELGLGNLERDEEILRAGLRFALPRGLSVGLGVERSRADFERSAERSNSGTSPILQVEYDGEPLFLALDLALRDLRPEPGSSFVPYQDVTGSLRLAWRTFGLLRLELFANRNLVYSTANRWAYFEDSALGAGVTVGLGSRTSFRVFVEEGVNEYVSFLSTPAPRADDFEAFGGDLRVRLGRFTLNLGASETAYDSNLPEFSRTTTVIRSGLNLGWYGGAPWG